jgi:hypothetical protein
VIFSHLVLLPAAHLLAQCSMVQRRFIFHPLLAVRKKIPHSKTSMVSPVFRISTCPINRHTAHSADLECSALRDEDPNKEIGERKFIEEIFSSSGVLSSLEHEHLVGATSEDMSTTGKYAAQIAEGARKRLEESVQVTQTVPIGTVTWTGRSGTAGKQEPPKRASASALLGKLKGKTVDIGGGWGGSPYPYERVNGKPPVPEGPLRSKMLELFEQKRGSVTTETIKKWCRARHIDQRNLDKAAEMKTVLREIAKLDKATHTWWLRPQFK